MCIPTASGVWSPHILKQSAWDYSPSTKDSTGTGYPGQSQPGLHWHRRPGTWDYSPSTKGLHWHRLPGTISTRTPLAQATRELGLLPLNQRTPLAQATWDNQSEIPLQPKDSTGTGDPGQSAWDYSPSTRTPLAQVTRDNPSHSHSYYYKARTIQIM